MKKVNSSELRIESANLNASRRHHWPNARKRVKKQILRSAREQRAELRGVKAGAPQERSGWAIGAQHSAHLQIGISELAGFLARPALNYNLGFGIELDSVAALAMKDAEETLFPAAEGEIGHGSGDADVDADVSGGGFVAEAAGGGTVGGEEGGLIAVGAAAEEVQGFVHRIGVDEA